MDMKIIFKGAAAGAAAGIAVYAFASAAPSKKMSIRRDAGKTAKAAPAAALPCPAATATSGAWPAALSSPTRFWPA